MLVVYKLFPFTNNVILGIYVEQISRYMTQVSAIHLVNMLNIQLRQNGNKENTCGRVM